MELITQIFRPLIQYLPRLLIKKYWNEIKLSNLIKFDILPRNTPVEVWLSQQATLQLWFGIDNKTPFDIIIDRMNIEFTLGWVNIPILYINRQKIEAGGSIKSLRVAWPLSGPNIESLISYIEKTQNENKMDDLRAHIRYSMEVDCKVHSFTVSGDLHEIHNIKIPNKPPFNS